MSYWVYSEEGLPNPQLAGKPSYTPEYMQAAGVQIIVPERTWFKIPDNFYNVSHRDWTDRQGHRTHVAAEDLIKIFEKRFSERGVIFLDHEPSDTERRVYEMKSRDANTAFRMTQVEWYENQVREREVTGQGRTKPTAYEDQCYTTLGLTKPYSVEAMRAQRHPGEAVGEQIVAALSRLEERRAQMSPEPPKPQQDEE